MKHDKTDTSHPPVWCNRLTNLKGGGDYLGLLAEGSTHGVEVLVSDLGVQLLCGVELQLLGLGGQVLAALPLLLLGKLLRWQLHVT